MAKKPKDKPVVKLSDPLFVCGHCGRDTSTCGMTPCPELPYQHGLCPSCAELANDVHKFRREGWKPKLPKGVKPVAAAKPAKPAALLKPTPAVVPDPATTIVARTAVRVKPAKSLIAADPIQERFLKFDAEHPDVYEEFKKLATDLKRTHAHYGAGAIFEVIRFHRATSAHGGKDFALNNSHRSRYARKLIAEDPSFADFFELRELRSAR